MHARAAAGTRLCDLGLMTVPPCQRDAPARPGLGPRRRPEMTDWGIAVLVGVAVVLHQ